MERTNYKPLIAAGTLLGIGLGGFVDGILFHQILQLHGMVTAYYPKQNVPLDIAYRNMQINMFWDGLFHTFTWLMTCTGVFLLWRAGQRPDVPWSSKVFAGSLPLGWGVFNLVEGIVDHSILHVHHVTETPNHLVWDIAFLGFGAALIAIGLVTIRAAKRDGRELDIPHPSST